MAGATATLTFAGDTRQLDKAFSDAGASTDRFASKVGDSTGRAAKSAEESSSRVGKAFEGIGDKTDESEQKFQGLADTITGTGDVIKGFQEGDIVGIATGFADLAGGLTDFVVPALSLLSTTMLETVIPAVWGFTTALLSNPLTWIVIGIIAVVAAIVLMATHWDKVKEIVGIVVDWIVARWKDFTGWISGIASKIGGFFAGMWESMKGGAKAALNWVIDRLNNAVDALNFLIRGINLIPFVSIPEIPHIPKFHQGGVVPGAPGSEMLAVLQAGERVVPADRSGGTGGATVTFKGNISDGLAALVMQMIRTGQIEVGV